MTSASYIFPVRAKGSESRSQTVNCPLPPLRITSDRHIRPTAKPVLSLSPSSTATMANKPARNFRPGYFLANLIITYSLWIITGALGYSDWPTTATTTRSERQRDSIQVLGLAVILPMYLLALSQVLSELGQHPSPRVPAVALGIAAALASSTTTAFCIVTGSWRNMLQHLFLVMGSVYAGCVLELVTGFVTGCLWWLGNSAQVESPGG